MSAKYLCKNYIDEFKIDIILSNSNKISVEGIDSNKVKIFSNNEYTLIEEAWNNTDVKYDFTLEGIKEWIILKDKSAPKKFQFKINGYHHLKIRDNDFIFFDKNNEFIYIIESPILILNDGSEEYKSESVKHNFDNGIYTVEIGDYDEKYYPLKIDPSFIFTDSKNYIEGDAVSGIKNSNIIITGSNSLNENLDFSNKIIETGLPKTLLGSDLVTFHRNVVTHFDFLSSRDIKGYINSIRISSNNKVTNIVADNKPDFIFYAVINPISVIAETKEPIKNYLFEITFSNTLSLAQNLTLKAELAFTPNGPEITDTNQGTITQPIVSSDNEFKYNLYYKPPSSLPSQKNMILRVFINANIEVNGRLTTISKTLFSSIQLVKSINKESFNFNVIGAARVDPINGDYYAPTSNRGVVVIDSSMGLVRTIDVNDDLPSTAQNVLVVNRIGTPEDPKGILICTTVGVYYFSSLPFDEPASYTNPKKMSSKIFIDFVMSGNYLFFLEQNGTIYRISYKKFLSQIENSSNDFSTKIDNILNSSEYQPFHTNNINSPNVYNPDTSHLPVRLLPISIKSDFPENFTTAYFSEINDAQRWHGISLIYKEALSTKKIILSILYSPLGEPGSTPPTNTDTSPDKESELNKVVLASLVESQSESPYEISRIATKDKPTIIFDWDIKKPVSEQYNFPILYIPQITRATSRVIVGNVLLNNNNNITTLSNSQPNSNKFYLCPRNISIAFVEEIGPFFDPITGLEVK